MAWILCIIMVILFNGMTEATTASAPSPDSFSPSPPPPPQEPDIWAPPPPREYIPPDDYPREGMRWCRDRNYSCYGTVMQCSTQYCPLYQCVMDCAACELTCAHPSPPNTTPTTPPPPPTPASPSPPDPYHNDDLWTPARPVYPDDFPVKGTRWCRDIGADCFGDSMVCDSQYCPLDQCYMDCNYCGLACRVPVTEPPWNSPPSPPSPPISETPPPISTPTPSTSPASSPSTTPPPIPTPSPSPASSPPSPTPSPASPPMTTPSPISAPSPAPSPPPASPPSKPPPHRSHKKRTVSKRVTCKSKKFPRCYGKSFVCPRSCRRTCKVNCVTCKPVCPKL